MELSRRDALRAGGGLLGGAALAGCVERRVTRRENNVDSSTTWVLVPGTGDRLDAPAFESYVQDMADVYGDSGVWGIGGPPDAEFETAYAQRLPVVQESSGEPGGAQPSLAPDDVDRASEFPVVDAAVAIYRTGGNAYRYWLWAAIDVRDQTAPNADEASVLSAGVSVRDGTVGDTGAVAREDLEETPDGYGARAAVDLNERTVAQFPLYESTNTIGTADRTEDGGYYVVTWSGGVDGVQSINGVCEVDRDGEYDLRWSVGGGFTTVERV